MGFIEFIYRTYGSKELAWLTIVFGIITITLTWLLFFRQQYLGALVMSGLGNLQTWTAYYELDRRKRNG